MLSRLKVLTSQPKIALGALLMLLLAAGAVVGSGADFTASSANPANTFASGTLSMFNSKAGSAVLTASNLRPGGPAQTGEVDIENTGSLSGDFTLDRAALTDSDALNPLSGKLILKVIDCGNFSGGTPTCDAGDPTVYSGTLAAMGETALETYDEDEKHKYQFSVQLDGTAGDVYQGDNSSVTFDFDAVQS